MTEERRDFIVGDLNVRVIANGYIDPASYPNIKIDIENSIVSKNVFESASGFLQTVSAA